MLTMIRILTTILFICVVSLALIQIGCKENDPIEPDPLDASRIEGHWVDMVGTLHPDWHYHFDRGLVTMEYVKAGAVLSSLTYPYTTRRDSVFIGGDATNAPRVWVLEFECDDVVEVHALDDVFSIVFWLERE